MDSELIGKNYSGSKIVWGISASRLPDISEKVFIKSLGNKIVICALNAIDKITLDRFFNTRIIYNTFYRLLQKKNIFYSFSFRKVFFTVL